MPQIDRRKFLNRTAVVWATPVVSVVALPAHAQTSTTPPTTAEPPTTLPPTTPPPTTPTPTTLPPTTPPPAICVDNVVVSDQVGPIALNFTEDLMVPQYSGPGDLDRVIVTFTQRISSLVEVENLDAQAQVSDISLDATVSIDLPIIGASPNDVSLLDSRSMSLGGYDQTTDFAGPSGDTYALDTGVRENIVAFTDPAAVAQFVGSSMLTFPVMAQGIITIASSVLQVNRSTSSGSAGISVEYICG